MKHWVLSLICSDFRTAMITSSRRILYFNYSKLTWQAFQIDYTHKLNIKYKITYNLYTKMKTKTATIYFMISEILYLVSFLYLVVPFWSTFCRHSTNKNQNVKKKYWKMPFRDILLYVCYEVQVDFLSGLMLSLLLLSFLSPASDDSIYHIVRNYEVVTVINFQQIVNFFLFITKHVYLNYFGYIK